MARILISAGEPSGDRYAAAVASRIAALRPGTEFAGLGGGRMLSAGVDLYRHNDRMTAMGIAEVVTALPRHARLLKRFRSVATRCKKTARNYASFVASACVFIVSAQPGASTDWPDSVMRTA